MSRALKLSFPMLLAALSAVAANPGSEFAAGQACYASGEFKKAVVHFQLALEVDPTDANSYYWIGRSYQVLADIAFPYAGKYTLNARVYLTKATELAPDRLDYRRQLFNLLLDSARSSRGAVQQATAILRTVSPNDPDYESMRQQLEQETRDNASASARFGRVVLAVPQGAYRVIDLAASISSTQRGTDKSFTSASCPVTSTFASTLHKPYQQ
jgi:tetratricopeptide (TPR) repeat protein